MGYRFLVIGQDLRISGTSSGIIERSFIAKLRRSYPDAVIDLLYLKHHPSDDKLELLPVDNVVTHVLDLKIPFLTKAANWFYWRLFHESLNERYILNQYAACIAKIDPGIYDHVFVRSSGLGHETILACLNLPILKKAIVTFHDPYPLFWYTESRSTLTKLELFRLRRVISVVSQARACISTAQLMSQDLGYLYGSGKLFKTLPHQYCESVFAFPPPTQALKKGKKVSISYHGAIQFGRNVDTLLDAYVDLLDESDVYRQDTEFILRLRGQDNARLRAKYAAHSNIKVLDTLDFANSAHEQIEQTDIVIILENGPYYCNILVGKAPFLAYYEKPVLCVSPKRSELRQIITDDRYIAMADNREELRRKLQDLIDDRFVSSLPVQVFGDYFDDDRFGQTMEDILNG